MNLLPESRERDVRELELRQLIISILQIARGYGGAETIAATESATVLAHKSGNVAHLINWVTSRCDFDNAACSSAILMQLMVPVRRGPRVSKARRGHGAVRTRRVHTSGA